jgi:hypothetical protein
MLMVRGSSGGVQQGGDVASSRTNTLGLSSQHPAGKKTKLPETDRNPLPVQGLNFAAPLGTEFDGIGLNPNSRSAICGLGLLNPPYQLLSTSCPMNIAACLLAHRNYAPFDPATEDIVVHLLMDTPIGLIVLGVAYKLFCLLIGSKTRP